MTDKRTFTAAFWALLLVQAVAAIYISRPWLTNDSIVYLQLASELPAYNDALRPPGYPLILWAWLPLPIAGLIVVQAVLYLASIYLIDRTLTDQTRSIFRVLAILYPFGAFYGAYVMGEAWVTLMLTVIALKISKAEATTADLVMIGVLAGLASLIRSDLVLLPILAVIVLLPRPRGLFVLLTAAAVLLPYAIVNHQNFGKMSPVPVAAAVGNSLYLATWQGKVAQEDLNSTYGTPSQKVIKSGLPAEYGAVNSSFGADPAIAPWNPVGYPTAQQQLNSNIHFREAAIERIRDDPASYMRHVVGNVWRLWNTGGYPAPALISIALTMVSGFVWFFGLLGGLIAVVKRAPMWRAAMFLAYPMVVHLPLHSEARYTAAARPLLLMFAALLITALVRRLQATLRSRRVAH